MRGTGFPGGNRCAWLSASRAIADRTLRSWSCDRDHAARGQNYAFQLGISLRSIWSPSEKASCLRDGKGDRLLRYNVPRTLLLSSGADRFTDRFIDKASFVPVQQTICQTRRRLGGRQPLWGMGVMSRIERTSSPAAASARTADSRPEPGPLTRTSTERKP